MRALALETYRLTKRFGDFTALSEVSIRVAPGTVHALLGENGAGKSTLVKCLVGYHHPDEGGVMIDGREQAIDSPQRARALGIGMVYQHFTLVPSMTVAENLVLARGGVPFVVPWRRRRAELEQFMQRTPFRLDLDAPVAALAAGERQKVEILKQLYADNRFLILDEPTSVLTPEESDEVLAAVRDLAHRGELTVLMITHKFREVLAYADDVSVLRRGAFVGGGPLAEFDAHRLAELMIGGALDAKPAPAPNEEVAGSTAGGRASETLLAGAANAGSVALRSPGAKHDDMNFAAFVRVPPRAARNSRCSASDVTFRTDRHAAAPPAEGDPGTAAPPTPQPAEENRRAAAPPTVLEVDGVEIANDAGRTVVQGVALRVAAGEIVGIAGVAGNGQRELVEALLGQRAAARGRIRVNGEPYRGRRAELRRHRVGSLPEEPLRNGVVARLSVADNMALRNFDERPLAHGAWRNPGAAIAQAQRWIEAFNVKTRSPHAPIATLSGGNVQRAVLARELSRDCRLLIVMNPVFGLDFAAVDEIHGRLLAARARGAAILLVSEDLDELLELSDRILVMSSGRITYETATPAAARAQIGRHMGGHTHDVEHRASTAEAATASDDRRAPFAGDLGAVGNVPHAGRAPDARLPTPGAQA
ncbi:MAG TPA: ABC transporter ATP-binding protein [Burkholderiaceae bacterium]|nr:ABC transporter ATP-binding protein [Burkholderiaceae bacterium]